MLNATVYGHICVSARKEDCMCMQRYVRTVKYFTCGNGEKFRWREKYYSDVTVSYEDRNITYIKSSH